MVDEERFLFGFNALLRFGRFRSVAGGEFCEIAGLDERRLAGVGELFIDVVELGERGVRIGGVECEFKVGKRGKVGVERFHVEQGTVGIPLSFRYCGPVGG